jgi:cytochrome P450
VTLTEHLDPFAACAADQRQRIYQQLASDGPVARVTMPSGVPVWLVTGFADVRRVYTDPRLVRTASPVHGYIEQVAPEHAPAMVNHMLRFEGEDHARLRRMIGAVFTRHQVDALAPRIQRITDDLLDAIEADVQARGNAEVNLIPAFAYPLPMTVICELVGVPAADQDALRAWTETVVLAQFADRDDLADAVSGLVAFLRALIADKRRQPRDDLLSALIAVRDGGDRLTEDELTSMVWILILAGHETTVNLISNGTRALLAHPEQLARLRAQPALMTAAVEELLRYDGPLALVTPMLATEPIQIGGVAIAAGETVVPALLPANRDPDHFDDPATLDVTRANNTHVAFGHGVHHCVGAPLARLEGRIALNTLLARFPRLRPAVPVEQMTRLPNPALNGLAALPVLVR